MLPHCNFISNPRIFTSFSFIVADWGDCSARCGEGIRKRRVECKIFLEFSKTIATLEDSKCPGPKPAETEICFAGMYLERTWAMGDVLEHTKA